MLMDLLELGPHGMCLLWRPGLIWPTVIGDIVIAFAYFTIPALLYSMLQLRASEYGRLVRWFIAFIFFCGLTHLIDVVTIWMPVYYLAAWVKVATAIVSCGAVLDLIRLISRWRQVFEAQLSVAERAVVLRVLQAGR